MFEILDSEDCLFKVDYNPQISPDPWELVPAFSILEVGQVILPFDSHMANMEQSQVFGEKTEEHIQVENAANTDDHHNNNAVVEHVEGEIWQGINKQTILAFFVRSTRTSIRELRPVLAR